MNREITIREVQELAQEFGVPFSMEVSGLNIIYVFGKVRWELYQHRTFTWEDYICIIKHLAATYPEKILQ